MFNSHFVLVVSSSLYHSFRSISLRALVLEVSVFWSGSQNSNASLLSAHSVLKDEKNMYKLFWESDRSQKMEQVTYPIMSIIRVRYLLKGDLVIPKSFRKAVDPLQPHWQGCNRQFSTGGEGGRAEARPKGVIPCQFDQARKAPSPILMKLSTLVDLPTYTFKWYPKLFFFRSDLQKSSYRG